MFRKGYSNTVTVPSFIIPSKRCWPVLIRIDPKFLAFPIPFFQTRFIHKVQVHFIHRVQANMKLIPSHPLGDLLRFWSRTFVLLASGLPRQTVFQPWSMSPQLISRIYPRYFTWGAALTSSTTARTQLYRKASLQTSFVCTDKTVRLDS